MNIDNKARIKFDIDFLALFDVSLLHLPTLQTLTSPLIRDFFSKGSGARGGPFRPTAPVSFRVHSDTRDAPSLPLCIPLLPRPVPRPSFHSPSLPSVFKSARIIMFTNNILNRRSF